MLFLLQSDQTVNNWPDYNVFGQFFLPVISFVLVCVLAYFASRWISGLGGGKAARAKVISIWDSISIGYQKNLQIIKIGDRFYLIAVTKDRVSFLAEIPEASIKDIANSDSVEGITGGSFDKYLKQILSKKKTTNSDNGDSK